MNQISGGKNRQQKREKQKNKKSKGSVYSKKHIRIQAELAKKRMNSSNKNNPKNNKGNKNIKKGGANYSVSFKKQLLGGEVKGVLKEKEQYRKKTEEIVKKHIERGRRMAEIQQKAQYCKNVKYLTKMHKKNIKEGKCDMMCIEEIKSLLTDTEKKCKSQLKNVKKLLPKVRKKPKAKQKGGGCKLGKFNPEKCCLPGIPCHYPCYREEYENDVGRCVNEDGKNANLKEIIELTNCERGEYNPDECCKKTEYGPACFAPCYDGENCYNTSGKIPLEKIYKRERAKNLMKKLVDQNAGAYEKIYNPSTRRWVSIKGKIGKNILQQYLNYV